MEIVRDIFEDVKKAIGCEYISDLPERKKEVMNAINDIDLNAYRKEHIIAFRRYVCGKDNHDFNLR